MNVNTSVNTNRSMSMLDDLVKEYGMKKVNSMTKYPSILTYHDLYKGATLNTLTEGKTFAPDAVLEMTEKVDGMNSRLIYLDDDFIIGERESIVFAKGDRIQNSPVISPMLNELETFFNTGLKDDKNMLTVIYGESYGYNIASKKQYVINSNNRKYRVFDIVQIPINDVHKILSMDIAQIASWRDHMHQPFVDTDTLAAFCKEFNIMRTPVIKEVMGSEVPTDYKETLKWMQDFATSTAVLDVPENGTKTNQMYARAEGVILRTKDRSMIRKFRFEEYQKAERLGWKQMK